MSIIAWFDDEWPDVEDGLDEAGIRALDDSEDDGYELA